MVALGLVSLAVALLLLVAEAHLSSGGLIAGGAVFALVCGAALLLVGAAAGLATVLTVSGGVSVAAGGGFVLLMRSLRSTRRLRPRSGTAAMVGHLGVVQARGSDTKVFVDGGIWRARPSPLEDANALHDGDRVVIERVTGLTLYVRKAEELELLS